MHSTVPALPSKNCIARSKLFYDAVVGAAEVFARRVGYDEGIVRQLARVNHVVHRARVHGGSDADSSDCSAYETVVVIFRVEDTVDSVATVSVPLYVVARSIIGVRVAKHSSTS